MPAPTDQALHPTGVGRPHGKDLEHSPKTCPHKALKVCLIIHTLISVLIILIFFYFSKCPEEDCLLLRMHCHYAMSAAAQTQE